MYKYIWLLCNQLFVFVFVILYLNMTVETALNKWIKLLFVILGYFEKRARWIDEPSLTLLFGLFDNECLCVFGNS